MSDDTDSLGLTRRQALSAAAALCGFGAVTAASTDTAHAARKFRVTLSDHPALGRVGGMVTVRPPGSTPVGVVRTGARTYVALSLRCPHEGGIVAPSGSTWLCPLHGSRFDQDGDVVSGLARDDLRRLGTSLKRGVLTIRL